MDDEENESVMEKCKSFSATLMNALIENAHKHLAQRLVDGCSCCCLFVFFF